MKACKSELSFDPRDLASLRIAVAARETMFSALGARDAGRGHGSNLPLSAISSRLRLGTNFRSLR